MIPKSEQYYMQLQHKFKSGKHAGKTLKDVIDLDKQYVKWYLRTFQATFRLHHIAMEYLKEKDGVAKNDFKLRGSNSKLRK